MDLISREELIEKLAKLVAKCPTEDLRKINTKTIDEAITSCRVYEMQKMVADIFTDAQLYRDPGAQRTIQSMLADKIGAGLFEGGAVKLFEEYQPATCQMRVQALVAVVIPENKEEKEKAAREEFARSLRRTPEVPEAVRKALLEEVIKIIKKTENDHKKP